MEIKVFFTNKKRQEENRCGWCNVNVENIYDARAQVIKQKNLKPGEFEFFYFYSNKNEKK